MREYKALDRFTLPGRDGEIVAIENDLDDPSELIGTQVIVDGKQYTVRGVEAPARAKPIPGGTQVGLYVEF